MSSNLITNIARLFVIVSYLVSTNIYNVQLSRMSHCAPVARKPICLEFTPEAAVGGLGDILVAVM